MVDKPQKHSKGREDSGLHVPRGLVVAEPLPGIQGGAVTRLRVDNTIFDGCRLQILGKDPFLLGQQPDNVGAGTGLGSTRLRGLFILETHKGVLLRLLI